MLLFYPAPSRRAEKHAAAAERPEMKTPAVINLWQSKLAYTAFLKSNRKDDKYNREERKNYRQKCQVFDENLT